jgi:hydrogenase expression/formation protein HypE
MNHTILLGHGTGGLMTGNLIRDVFMKHFCNAPLLPLSDSAILRIRDTRLAFTTDSFVVDPLFFPGGDIGRLAVSGTVNDLSVSGATPLYLSSAFIIEEGFSLEMLEKIVISMSAEAERAGVQIVTGDTKVVKKGQCDKLFINTAGIGLIDKKHETISSGTGITSGDQILVNGYLGDHEMAVLSARENITFEEPVYSDVSPLNHMIQAMLNEGLEIHFMRDITRGGLATILAEIAGSHPLGIHIEEQLLPVRQQVNGLCEVYGFNPLYLANEGKILVVIKENDAEKALGVMKQFKEGAQACRIGSITGTNHGRVLMKSLIGGTRIIDRLAGEQLPRIC